MQNPAGSSRASFFARHWGKLWIVQALLLVLVGFLVARSLLGTSDGATGDPNDGGHAEHANAAKIWTCAMHPQIRRDGPGKCPLCGMELVPVKASTGGMRTITISPTARKLMRIATTPVERRYVTAEIRAVGKVEYDETRLSHITAWVSGRLDRLYVNYTGIEVKKGHHLAYIYSEELYTAQEELLQAIKHKRERPPSSTRLIQPIDYVASSREKLRLLGLTARQIQELEERGTPTDHITIHSEIGGVVIEKLRQEGDRVRTGDRIYTVADLSQVWVKLDAYESDLQWLRYGQEIEFATEAYPGETFNGRIAFMDRTLDAKTRTLKVRVNVSNLDGRLKPEMFVRAVIRSRVAAGGRVLDAALAGKWISPMHPEIVSTKPGNCDICGMPLVRAETLGYVTASPNDESKPLVIPTTAALVTGKRAIVYVEVPTAETPTFEGREIVLGPRAGNYYLVRRGLKEGELVVTNGNFKLDSALQISAKPSMMTPEGGGGGGHDHGGGSKSNASGPSSAAGVPRGFKKQLEEVFSKFDAVTKTIELAELAKIRLAFEELGKAVSRVDGKPLSEHAASLWSELSMLLLNDATEGSELATLQDADRLYAISNRHVQRVREGYGLVEQDPSAALVKLDAPAIFQDQLARLWQAYLPIGQALAADDLPGAKGGISKLRPAVDSIDPSPLKGAAAEAWRKEHANLVKLADDLSRAPDIKATRAAFSLLSDEMLALVRSFGMGNTGPIFELHCSMAFGSRGASWLQSDKQVRNPYFGGTMLKCANRVDLISPAK